MSGTSVPDDRLPGRFLATRCQGAFPAEGVLAGCPPHTGKSCAGSPITRSSAAAA